MFDFLNSIVGKKPKPGDAVWWAKKEVEGRVTSVGLGVVNFAAGGPCETPRGRKVANRYTVSAPLEDFSYDKSYDGWIIGQGPMPKNVRGKLVMPKPVNIKGGVRNG